METAGKGSHSMAKFVCWFFCVAHIDKKTRNSTEPNSIRFKRVAFARHFIAATHISSRAVAKVDDFSICAKTHVYLFALLMDRLRTARSIKTPFLGLV